MSILVRNTQRATPNPIQQADDKTARVSSFLRVRHTFAEAPDAGYAGGEAPESRGSMTEAPEARTSVMETPTYYGRSRS